MLLDPDDCQLVLVDYQTRLMPVIFESELVVANAVRLARMAQALQVPVWGTEQMPEKLGTNMPDVVAAIEAAGGRTLAKAHFSAMADGLATGCGHRLVTLRNKAIKTEAMPAACPSICKKPHPSQKRPGASSSSQVAKPMCACCKLLLIC